MKKDSSSSQSRSVVSFLNFNYWTLHEAAYVLTGSDSSPPFLGWGGVPHFTAERTGRGAITFWKDLKQFSLKKGGEKFGQILDLLEKAIKDGKIRASREGPFPGNPYGEPTVIFVPAGDVMMWALDQGIVLPDPLAQEMGLFQMADQTLRASCYQKVRNQIVGQFILGAGDPMSMSALIKDPLMRKFGSWKESKDETEHKSIRRALNELYESPGTKGAPSKINGKRRLYVPMPISSIVSRRVQGCNEYCFPLLKKAITTAVDVKIELMGQERFRGVTEPQFQEAFFLDPVVYMYVQGASVNAVRFMAYQMQIKLRFFYSHPKLCLIPVEERKDMTIGELCEKNCEYFLEPFTEAERKLIEDKGQIDPS